MSSHFHVNLNLIQIQSQSQSIWSEIEMESHQIDAEMLKKVWEYNQSIRSVVDWIVT